MEFIDGILIGQFYFITIPMIFILIAGSTSMSEIAATYRPFEDVGTTTVIIGGMYLLAVLRFIIPRYQAPIINKKRIDRTDPRILPAMLLIFLATTLVTFQAMGLSQGGHWQENLATAFENNPLLVVVKYAANWARNGIFGLLLYAVVSGRMRRNKAIIIGLVVSLCDLFLTFNRITAVFLLISALLMYRTRPYVMLSMAASALLLLSTVSVFWPMFRGIATQKGYTIEAMIEAAHTSADRTAGADSLDKSLNGVFESSNIVVLDWVVKHTGTIYLPTLNGTMFVRAATPFIPSSIWPNRPRNFGLIVGSSMGGIEGLALNSTLYGESYANFGLLWPVGLSVFLIAIHFLFRAIGRNSSAVGFIGAFAAIAIWRFDAAFIGVAVILTLALTLGLRVMHTKGRRQSRALNGKGADAHRNG
jgi:hypothetical protein